MSIGAVYSILGHKEARFVHDAMVLLQLFVAHILVLFCHDIVAIVVAIWPRNICSKSVRGRVRSWESALGLWIAFGLSLCYLWDGWRTRDIKDWHEFEHMNRALAFVGRQSDATGLILTGYWWDTAGYSALHKAIPVVYAVDDESLEVHPDPMAMLGYHCDANFPDRFSPTYWEYAKKGVVHEYLKSPRYNYLAIPATEKNEAMAETFRQFGFTTVHRLEKATVYAKPPDRGAKIMAALSL